MRSKTVRWPQGDRKATVWRPRGTFTVVAATKSAAAARTPYYFLGTQDRMRPYVDSRPPNGDLAIHLRCSCGFAALRFLKRFNVKLKKPAMLATTLWRAKTVRSPYGFHKNRKAAVRFGELSLSYGRHKHAASCMWPWHKDVRTVASPAVESSNISRDSERCVWNEP